jgi:hypothetical protein
VKAEDSKSIVLAGPDGDLIMIKKSDIAPEPPAVVVPASTMPAPSSPKSIEAGVGRLVKVEMRNGDVLVGKVALANGISAKIDTADGGKFIKMANVKSFVFLADAENAAPPASAAASGAEEPAPGVDSDDASKTPKPEEIKTPKKVDESPAPEAASP